MKSLRSLICLLTLTCMFITLIVPTALASPKSIEQKVTLYYPNGDWEFTPVETAFVASDKNNLYLVALQQLADPESLPTGCYDEFPESFKVKDVRVSGKTAYVIISDSAFEDPELSNGWLNTLGDIISYNLFKMNEKIDVNLQIKTAPVFHKQSA